MLKQYYEDFKLLPGSARLFLTSCIFQSLTFGIYMVIFNLYLLEIGLNEKQIGTIASVAAFLGALTSLLSAPYVLKLGFRKCVLIAKTASVSALLFLLFTTDYHLILILAAMYGCGTGLIQVLQAPITMEIVPQKLLTFFFSIRMVAFILSGVAANSMAGFVPTFFQSWFGFKTPFAYRLTLLTAACTMCVALFLFLRIRESGISQGSTGQSSNILSMSREFRSWKKLLCFLIPTFLIGLGAGAMVPLFNIYFKQKLCFSLLQISMLFTVSQVTLAFFTFILPTIAVHFRPATFVLLTQMLSLPFILMIINTVNYYLVTISYTLRAGLMNMSHPIQNHFEMACFTKQERPFVSGSRNFAWRCSWAISTYIAGRFQSMGKFDLPLYFALGCYILSISSYALFFFQKEERYICE